MSHRWIISLKSSDLFIHLNTAEHNILAREHNNNILAREHNNNILAREHNNNILARESSFSSSFYIKLNSEFPKLRQIGQTDKYSEIYLYK